MADALEGPIPVIHLYAGMVVRFEAIDPTTGADVAGVVVRNVAVYGQGLDDEAVDKSELAVWLQPTQT